MDFVVSGAIQHLAGMRDSKSHCSWEHLMMLYNELRQQKKIVMSLQKKSLWSRKLEEILVKHVWVVKMMEDKINEEIAALESSRTFALLVTKVAVEGSALAISKC
ncbi:hypothetical protein BVRB_9g215270 [Beta vulgaris subsp. vulgaris]|nr:hypothetical protein BVRB_9g215270 [Beta vulgaris subsp. vulgaris]